MPSTNAKSKNKQNIKSEIKTETEIKIKKSFKPSERQIEYLILSALGKSNKQIASILNVSESTVKKTLENISETLYSKGECNTRTYTITSAFTLGILSPKVIDDIKEKYHLKDGNKDNNIV